MNITLSHGAGGTATSALIHEVFAKHFDNEILCRMEDAAVLQVRGRIAMTTDSFVVTPLFFPGGDIGKLAVCGTVNDLLMAGACPRWMTAAFILEEGLPIDTLDRIASSMAAVAKEAGVLIVAGDTKVVEGKGGLYINTSGIGEVVPRRAPSASGCKEGDVILVSGALGDHHACILSARMGIANGIQSDCAPLNQAVLALFRAGIRVHALRDATRGGVATVLCELAEASSCGMELWEDALPVHPEVQGLCGLLGLDPLYMGNEGKFVAVVDRCDAKRAIEALQGQPYAGEAVQVGCVLPQGRVVLKTAVGGNRVLGPLYGEGLPRIC